MQSMTLEQARAEKAEAESQILKIINDFQERTGLCVERVAMSKTKYIWGASIGGPTTRYEEEPASVKVIVESI